MEWSPAFRWPNKMAKRFFMKKNYKAILITLFLCILMLAQKQVWADGAAVDPKISLSQFALESFKGNKEYEISVASVKRNLRDGEKMHELEVYEDSNICLKSNKCFTTFRVTLPEDKEFSENDNRVSSTVRGYYAVTVSQVKGEQPKLFGEIKFIGYNPLIPDISELNELENENK